MSFHGKVVIVTGATSGIGRATAEAFAREGASLVLVGRDESGLAEAATAIRLAGGREVCFACTVDSSGVIQTARVVARGDAVSVLALPGFASRGGVMRASRIVSPS